VYGELSSRLFEVEIGRKQSVSVLKELIKEKRSPILTIFPPTALIYGKCRYQKIMMETFRTLISRVWKSCVQRGKLANISRVILPKR
jgi:hypothetical protein